MSALVASAVQESVTLNLGQWSVSAEPDKVLTCLGLGSCVALCLHDPKAGVGGMAHMVLPSSREGKDTSEAKFVDLAVPMVIEEMERHGAERRRMACYLVGGAHILTNTTTVLALVGERNVEAARAALQQVGVRVKADDVGGERGRTVRLYVASGEVVVALAGAPGQALSNGRA